LLRRTVLPYAIAVRRVATTTAVWLINKLKVNSSECSLSTKAMTIKSREVGWPVMKLVKKLVIG